MLLAIQWYLYSIDKLLLLVDSIVVPAPHSVSVASLQEAVFFGTP